MRIGKSLRTLAILAGIGAWLGAADTASAQLGGLFRFFRKTDDPPAIPTKGPGEIPERLVGRWKISLCLNPYHAWIRYEKVDGKEVHTLSRFQQGRGGHRDATGRRLTLPVEASGVSWDNDLVYESLIRKGKCLFLSTVVENPVIYLGQGEGRGYSIFGNTCVTQTREAWRFYTGEQYDIDATAMPGDLAMAVVRRHPSIRLQDRIPTLD